MLTKRQKEVLDFIKKYQSKFGYSPSLEDIRKNFSLASVSTAHFHVKRLEELGHISKLENTPRAIDLSVEDLLSVPVLGEIAAGQPIEAIAEGRETVALPRNRLPRSGDFYALRVKGESMIKENIHDRDIVVIRSQSIAENGEKVVALINNHVATLKKLYIEKDRIRLQPANPSMKPIYVGLDELTIQGKVVAIIKTK